jgi:DNA-damage-inducible protein J
VVTPSPLQPVLIQAGEETFSHWIFSSVEFETLESFVFTFLSDRSLTQPILTLFPNHYTADGYYVLQLQYIYIMEVPVNKTTTITIRMDPQVKKNAVAVLKSLGLTTTQAVTLFFTQVSLNKGIPFDVHIPNETTAKAIKNGLDGRGLYTAANMDDLIAQLEA